MTRQTAANSLKAIVGAFLLAIGLVILFVNLDGVTATLSNSAGLSGHEGLDIVPAIGLAGLHALQAYSFDSNGFIAGFLRILVSFWPLVLIYTGAVVLGRVFVRRSVAYSDRPGSSIGGGQ